MKTEMLEVLKKMNFAGLDYDDLMDRRDEPEFDSEWGEAYERIEGRQELVPMKGEIDLIREWSFRYVFSQTGHHEMAATVSDDFDLIVSAAILGIDDGWINALWWEYKSGRIPVGVLARRPGAVKDNI